MDGDILRIFDTDNTLLFKVKRSSNRIYKTILRTRRPTCLSPTQDDNGWLWHARNASKEGEKGHLWHARHEVKEDEKGHQFFDPGKRKMLMSQDVSQKKEVVSQKNEVASLKKKELSPKKDELLPKKKVLATKNVDQFGLLECNTKKSPVEPEVKKDEDGENVDPTKYTRVAGCLKYLTYTRPDLSFSVGIASRFM